MWKQEREERFIAIMCLIAFGVVLFLYGIISIYG